MAALLASPIAHASPDTYGTGDGHSGNLNPNGMTINNLNKFAQLTADIKAGDTTLTVDVGANFVKDDLIMVWQVGGYAAPMSGAPGPFDLSKDLAGRYELARVKAVNGNVLTVDAAFVNAFASNVTQIVQVPEYMSVNLNNSTINAPPWNGRTGGVVAFLSKGGVTLNGGSTISADAAGFRGGLFVNSPMMNTGCMGLDEAAPGGAQKGEGEASAKYGPMVTGYGNVANGGGGGICQNSGGGGGGNGGAGGKGGRTSVADMSRDLGGRGGGAMVLSLVDRLTFGGGGGAGHGDDGRGSSGGGGGGVIFVRADSLNNTGVITASGGNAPASTGLDGAGGGGAGGSIVVRVVKGATCGSILAGGGVGGNGGRQFAPGGGGGGGRILLQATSQNMCNNALIVDGNQPGVQGDGALPDGVNYGAKAGSPGVVETAPGPGGYCGSDMDCGGATPACQPKGFCAPCSMTNTSKCTGLTPTCDVPTGMCRGCKVDADCMDPKAPACQPNGSCGECSQTNGSLCKGRKPVCNVNQAICVACATDADCKDPALPICQTMGGQSGACGQCAAGKTALCKGTTPICNVGNYTCKACKNDNECTMANFNPALPVCLMSGACVQCTTMKKAQCVAPTPTCNDATNMCVLCVPGVDSSACAMNTDGKSCQPGPMGNPAAVFCGCASDADCGAMDSGRVCDAASHKCTDGCSPAPNRNKCPAMLVCTSSDLTGMVVGMCTKGCLTDDDCKGMSGATHCLKGNPVGRCVACASDADCAGEPVKKVCADDTNKCEQCTPMKTAACDPKTVGGACLPARVCGCTTDSDCGGPTSGRICDEQAKTCGPGCRGAGGNGCGPGETCSSKDNTPGTCMPNYPVTDGGMPSFNGGGACAVGAGRSRGGSLPIVLLLGAVALVAWRRRGRSRGAIAALLLAFAALAPNAARAQNANIQLNRYEPAAAGDWTFAVEHPWYSSTRWFAGGLTLNYARNPLLFGSRDASGQFTSLKAVVANQLLGHLDLAGSMFDRVALTVSLPVSLFESGDAVLGAGPASRVVVGDPRVGVRARLFGQPDKDPISLSVGVQLWIPIGTKPEDHAGDGGVRVMPKLIASGFASQLRWSASAAFLYRPDATIGELPPAAGNTVGSALEFGAAIGWGGRDRRFHIGPELVATTGVTGDHKFSKERSNVELLFGGQYLVANALQVGAAVGGGLLRGEPGSPDLRVLLRIAYAPIKREEPRRVEPDTDGDGILDKDDACPQVKGIATGDPRTNGCPPPPPEKDADQDGIPDDVDNCPMEPQGLHPDPARKGCPAADTDKDGFFDYQDQCPDLPAGAHPDPKRQGCPALDTDNDGVFDPDDQCPVVPAGLHPDPAKPGCPEPDKDGDSVPDPVDACPEKPGAPDPDPKKNGCPGLVQVKNGVIVILEPVFFATNKDVILPKSFPVLKAVANALKAQPVIKLLAIEGHTDNKGKLDKNMDLSDRRAKSVLKFLVKEGIEEGRLTAQGFGPKRPIATNSTEAGRAQNRRVEFHIVDPPASAAPPAETPPVKAN